jgi:DNA polymerase-3 subunit delta'
MRTIEIPEYPEADRAPGCAHPRETYDLIGHGDAEAQFIRAKQSGRLHHAWLISGPKGVGKATLAYRMIRAMLGGESLLSTSLDIPAADPVAQRVEAQGHGNLFVLRRPYNEKTKKLRSEIPVDAVRAMSGFFENTSAEDGLPRIALVDTMDEMNRSAENAILKTLEEPPENALIILLANSPGRLLPTIRSRCLSLPLRPVSEDEIGPWLKRQTKAEDAIIDAAVGLSRGGPGKAVALAQNADFVLKPLTRFLSSLERNDKSIDHILSNMLAARDKTEARSLFWDCLQDILREQASYCVTGEWHSAFKPLPADKTPQAWMQLWKKVSDWQTVESAINMDKKTVMLTALSEIRAA